MKQNITTKQLNEAHPMDTLNLAVMLDISCNDYRNDNELDKMVSERITIGKMIEILGNDFKFISYHDEPDEWVVNRMTHNSRSYRADNLCDALWEAVKEVLKG